MPLSRIYKLHISPDRKYVKVLKNLLGFVPGNLSLYKMAFRHKSVALVLKNGSKSSNERLEFLGDAVLGSVVAEVLFKLYPYKEEGFLTEMRSKIVSREHLNELGRDFNLIHFVESKVSSSQFGENIHGNLFEAFIGAIYLDRGFVFCEKFIQNKIIKQYVDIAKLEGKVISYKSLIIEWCQKEKIPFAFDFVEDNGMEGQKYFGVKLSINQKIVAKARATSKKKAEEKASQRAYFALQEKISKK